MNIFNILAGVLGFITGTGLIWGLWEPATDWIGSLSADLRIFMTLSWFVICFVAIIYVPLMLLIGDDTGRI